MGIRDFLSKQSEPTEKQTLDASVSVLQKGNVSRTPKKSTRSSSVGAAYDRTVHFLLSPLVTEKATRLSAEGQYAFRVHVQANKTQIREAVGRVYRVHPIHVTIVSMRGKNVRYGKTQGKRKAWKKAVVTLKKGEKIQMYEGV